ncbi:hypothetical protein [Alkalihalobacillus sp. TS-13]|nr:hypothetical protein [Alkalihalobacillus sp. TS-13]
MKDIDWQLIAFVTVSILHDHWVYSRLPKLYYYDAFYPEQREVEKEE